MHGVNFGQMSPQGSPRSHLNPTDRFQRIGGLDQRRVARRFTFILFFKIPRKCVERKNEKKKSGENPAPNLTVNFYLQQKPDSNMVARMEFLDENNKLIKSYSSKAEISS